MVAKTRVSIDEFLAMPETEPPSELIDGEVVQKPMPNDDHGQLTSWLIIEIGIYLRQLGRGFVVNEVRHADRREEWVYVPDIEVRLAPRTGGRGSSAPVEGPPDMAIEVLSPGDRPGRLLERVSFYMRTGVALLWVVDPADEQVTVYRPGESPSTFGTSAVINAAPVLPEFELDLAALFAILPDEE
jgi:Uma2 family endonuclease